MIGIEKGGEGKERGGRGGEDEGGRGTVCTITVSSLLIFKGVTN